MLTNTERKLFAPVEDSDCETITFNLNLAEDDYEEFLNTGIYLNISPKRS